MSKKRKKSKARRPGCGGKLKGRGLLCRRCEPDTGNRAVKTAPAFLAKAFGANVVPMRAPRHVCWAGGNHVNKASAKWCTTCGTELAATYGEHLDQVTKARRARMAIPGIGSVYGSDPAQREVVRKMLGGGNGWTAS